MAFQTRYALGLAAWIVGTGAAYAQPQATDPVVLGPYAQTCASNTEPAYLVTITGFKDRKGQTRLELYAAKNGEFLIPTARLISAGKVFKRIDLPTAESGDMVVCMPAPGPGNYALVVLHDRNTDGSLNIFSDGVGFSRNPKLGLSKPKVDSVSVPITTKVESLTIVLNYLSGMRPTPIHTKR